MPAYALSNKVRVASLYNLGFEFSPSLAFTAKNFETLGVDVRSFRVPLKTSIQEVIAPSIGANFLAGGRPEAWTPLQDDTIVVKGNSPRTKYPVSDPLMRSGLLFKTMQQYNIWTVTTTEASIQSLPDKIWYGNLHQSGLGSLGPTAAQASGGTMAGFRSMIENVLAAGASSERGKYIPARPFAMVQTEDLDKIVAVFTVWINARIAARLGV